MSDRPLLNPNRAIPAGTQVVTRIEVKGRAGERAYAHGTVGIVVAVPDERSSGYLVRFPDGFESVLQRHDIAIRKHVQREGLLDQPDRSRVDLYDYVIYRCVVGSRAYDLDQAGSDTDYRGIYLPPAELHWSLAGVPEQLENDATEEVYWELQKFIVLALKANPNVLECLYTPLVELATPLANELLEMRAAFLSQLIFQTYNGYVMSQFKTLDRELRNQGTVKWKHVMHLIRLLLSGITVLRECFVPVRMADHREHLLAIRQGNVPWEEVNAWRLRLHAEFDAAVRTTSLPEHPDYELANAFLIKARRTMAQEGGTT